MPQFYQLTDPGEIPVQLEEAKSYLRLPESLSSDNELIVLFLEAATSFAEKYVGRSLRPQEWTVLVDEFEERICLRKAAIDSITSITYRVGGVGTVVPSSVYYLKKSTQQSEVLLQEDQEWPTDGDESTREQTIEIVVATVAEPRLEQAKVGILRHVAYLYENRGDCGTDADVAKASGASHLYDQIRVSRV